MALKLAHFAGNAVVACPVVIAAEIRVKEHVSLLLIDHEQAALAQLAEILSAAGYHCSCCINGEAAAECVRKLIPDLIISDTNLAGHSGVALCERLKKSEGMAEVPLMFFSGTQIPDIIRRSHADGGTYYLRKPYDPEVLLELIGKALEAARRTGGVLNRN
jgi:CheY-like chemotaxis protein